MLAARVVGFAPILLKKSFCRTEQKFSKPLTQELGKEPRAPPQLTSIGREVLSGRLRSHHAAIFDHIPFPRR